MKDFQWKRFYCEICGKTDTNCICPECPECGEAGNTDCYESHGMVRTKEQIDSMRKAEEQQFVDSPDEKDFQWKRFYSRDKKDFQWKRFYSRDKKDFQWKR